MCADDGRQRPREASYSIAHRHPDLERSVGEPRRDPRGQSSRGNLRRARRASHRLHLQRQGRQRPAGDGRKLRRHRPGAERLPVRRRHQQNAPEHRRCRGHVRAQIVKEPRGLKGARVSTNISLPGRYLILMPTGKFSGVSRKIESTDERNRLKTIMKAIRPDGMATVVRTAAGGVSNAELIADLGILIRMWHGILEQYKRIPSPALLHKDMNLVYKTARDFITPDVDHVWLDDETETDNVTDFMRLLGPQYVDRIKYYEHGKRLFAAFT